MKRCPTCQNKYPDDANFCPREECAAAGEGPRRLLPLPEEAPPSRFVPISRLGGRSTGEIWQASDAQTGAAVALKVVTSESLPTPMAQDRAQRELRQLQRAASSRLVKVIDFGKGPDGHFFIASELVGGEPLDQIVAHGGPMSLDRAKRIVAQIGEALLEAQKVGVVHRDLAGKNILISADDEVRVINFVLARPLVDNIFGVPEYMSPEQAEGKLVDQRSNTYGLAAIFYLMLTGHPPHSGAGSPMAALEEVLRGEITPPSIRRGSGLTGEVDRVVLKALERNSSRRHLTMRQFLTEVAGLIALDEPVATQSGPTGARESVFARTMMFAGGSNEVQKLVAQAMAARAASAAGGNGAPDPGAAAAPGGASPTTTLPPSSPAAPAGATPSPLSARLGTPSPLSARSGTPAPFTVAPPPSGPPRATTPPLITTAPDAHAHGTGSRPSHGAAVAATMIAMPSPNGLIPGATPPPSGTPPFGTVAGPLEQGEPPSPGTSDPGHAPESGRATANFRETLWFKKGDVDQMVAEARAKAAAAAATKHAESAAATEEAAAAAEVISGPASTDRPLDERYTDDGSVSPEDRRNFSLSRDNSGKTATPAPAAVGASGRVSSMPGERMSDGEMISEIGGGKRIAIIVIVAAVVVALVAVVVVTLRGRGEGGGSEGATTGAAPAPAAGAPPPAAAAGAAANPPAAAVPSTSTAAKSDDEVPPGAVAAPAETAKPAPTRSSRPTAAAKKKAAKKKAAAGKRHR